MTPYNIKKRIALFKPAQYEFTILLCFETPEDIQHIFFNPQHYLHTCLHALEKRINEPVTSKEECLAQLQSYQKDFWLQNYSLTDIMKLKLKLWELKIQQNPTLQTSFSSYFSSSFLPEECMQSNIMQSFFSRLTTILPPAASPPSITSHLLKKNSSITY